MLVMKTITPRCTPLMLAVLMWIVPMTLHAQAQNHTPVDDAADAPKIVFESLEHDFGTAKPNESLTHEFVFSNQGTAALIIEKVKAG